MKRPAGNGIAVGIQVSKPDSLSAHSGGSGSTTAQRHGANKYPVLDFLRFGASLVVMLSHLRDQYFAPYGETLCGSALFRAAFFFATRLGLESVVLFFVLSGYLVGGMSLERSIDGQFSPAKYTIDRFTRIYTPLVPTLLIALTICLATHTPFSVGNFFVNLFSLQGVFGNPFPMAGALWSLSYEVWFYILFGALLCLVRQSSRMLKLMLLSLVLLSGFVFSRLIATWLFVWLAGMACYFIGRPKHCRLFLPAALAIVALGVSLTQITSKTSQVDFRSFRFVDQSVAILVLALGLALLLPLAAHVRLNSRRGKRVAKAGGLLASFSYSLYLAHLPVEQLLLNVGLLHRHNVLNAETLAGYFAMALFQLLVAYGFYFCFERHTPWLRQWLHRLTDSCTAGGS
jgi:peptidoglycan/LPS O-acetylase OafA/YrhL